VIWSCFVTGSAAAAWPGAALAGPATTVTSALDEDDPFDVQLTLDYDFVLRTSAIGRERIQDGREPGDGVAIVRDLVYRSSGHVLTPRLELGIYHDVWLSAALPIVVTDQRTLSLDRRDKPCNAQSTCVGRATSSTVTDGLLPSTGFDSRSPDNGFGADDDKLFRGPDRHGVDQIHVGFGVAPMNQLRDDTKPTWKLGAEARIGIGAVARLDRGDPEGEVGVGTGVHELRLWTSIAKRRGWAVPSVDLWWQAPFANSDDSPFDDPGYGSRVSARQQQAGVAFGIEAIAVDRPEDGQRVSVDIGGRFVSHFEGRAYTEMWEVFAYAGQDGGPLTLDQNPTDPGAQPLAHPGISTVENFLEMGGHIALRAELGPWVHIGAIAQVTTESQHAISFADAGVDLPTCSATVTSGCETGNNDVVNPGTSEVNPTHAPLVDLVGHRYIVDDVLNLTVGVEARVLF
jgi:hypothetical protein